MSQTSSPLVQAATLPYPNALQARQTTVAHRRIAVAAVVDYQDNLAEEQARLQRDDVVLSEEETARLERRVAVQASANATADQFRQRACDVVYRVQDHRTDAAEEEEAYDEGEEEELGDSGSPVRDVYHAACDGDVGALAAWVRRVASTSSLPRRINALGQPDPATYNGVQFQQRWLFRAPPLIFAAAFGREEAVAFLLQHGADSQVKSSTGLRAVDYAEKRGYSNIVAMLRG